MTDLLDAEPFVPLAPLTAEEEQKFRWIALDVVRMAYWQMENEKLQLTFDF